MSVQEPLITDLAFDVPLSAIKFGDNWMGHWAIQQETADGLLQIARSLDLKLHLQQHAAAGSSPASGKPQVSAERIAVVFLEGVLMRHEASMMESTSTVLAKRQIKNAAADDSVAGILLRITSPGGTVAGTGELAAAVAAAAAKKPVFAYCEDLCCSAAYWIASQATKIICNPTALVGSIGTYMAVADFSGAAAMEGVKVHVVRAGSFKGAGVKGTEITADHLAKWQQEVDALNEHFLAGVASGRKLSIEQVRQLADGRVHVGQAALQNKLVDAVSSAEDAIGELVTVASASKAKGTRMSAATLPQLKEACPGASSDFLLAQLEGGATAEAAGKAWMTELVKQRDTANQAKADAEKKAGEAEKSAATAKVEAEKEAGKDAKANKPGVPPVKSGKQQAAVEEGIDPVADYTAKVKEVMQEQKCDRVTACTRVSKAHPQLHAAYLLATNTSSKAQRLIREKLE